jgi:dTDP-4-dehydrorhamnose 3,5-epimerase-like enzyme
MTIRILKPIYERQDKRGLFQEVIRGYDWKTVITGHMIKGSEIGHHYHKNTVLFFFITSGSVDIIVENVKTHERDQLELKKCEGVLLHPGQAHVITFQQESNFLLLKSLSYDPDNTDTHPYHVSR